MALPTTALPYGIRDIKISPIDAAGAVGTAVDLPNGRTLAFSEAEDFEELRGDDTVVAIRGKGPQVEWELEGGGISLAAYKVLAGGTTTSSGTTPAAKNTYRKLGTDVRPYFQIEGQAISDSGGDMHCIIYRARCNDAIEGTFEDGGFFLTSASGVGLPRPADSYLYDLIHNETAVAIT